MPIGRPIYIRPYQLSDANALAEAARESTREVFRWLPWCHSEFSREEAREWLESQSAAWAERREFDFCIIDRRDGAFLGGCAINQIHHGHRFANVGYWVRTSATRRGVAAAAVAQLIDFARAETDLVRLEIVVEVENRASARIAEKVGAVYEGTLRSRVFLHGASRDALMFSVILPR